MDKYGFRGSVEIIKKSNNPYFNMIRKSWNNNLNDIERSQVIKLTVYDSTSHSLMRDFPIDEPSASSRFCGNKSEIEFYLQDKNCQIIARLLRHEITHVIHATWDLDNIKTWIADIEHTYPVSMYSHSAKDPNNSNAHKFLRWEPPQTEKYFDH